MNGHSSSSGANRVDEADCIARFEEKLLRNEIATRRELDAVWARHREEMAAAYARVKQEPYPDPSDLLRYTYSEPKDQYYDPKPKNPPTLNGGQNQRQRQRPWERRSE